MISKIDQYVIDKVRERRIELGVSQAVLADYIEDLSDMLRTLKGHKSITLLC